jgi:hypothetical protein
VCACRLGGRGCQWKRGRFLVIKGARHGTDSKWEEGAALSFPVSPPIQTTNTPPTPTPPPTTNQASHQPHKQTNHQPLLLTWETNAPAPAPPPRASRGGTAHNPPRPPPNSGSAETCSPGARRRPRWHAASPRAPTAAGGQRPRRVAMTRGGRAACGRRPWRCPWWLGGSSR